MQDKDIAGSLQNDFFNQAKRDRSRLTVFLNSGKKLTGRIKGFDRFTIILDGPGGEQMIFKHAIATVNSARTFGNYMDLDGAVRRGGIPSPEPGGEDREDLPPGEGPGSSGESG